MPLAEQHRTYAIPLSEGYEVHYYVSADGDEQQARIFPPHVHDCLEMYILMEGDASFMVEQHLFALRAGDIVISKPNEMHHCILNSNSPHRHACFWIETHCEWLSAPFYSHRAGEGNLIRPTKEDSQKIQDLLLVLEDETKTADSLEHLRLLTELFCYIKRNFQAGVAAVQNHPPVLQAILNDIAEHYRDIHDLDYLSEKYFISRSTLSRLFRQHLHTTPHLYLETKRLARSRELLRQGKSVTEACMEAGFCDCSHYIRIFRSRFGITPLQYKNS